MSNDVDVCYVVSSVSTIFRVDLSNVTIVWCISFFLGLLKSRSSNFMIYNIDDVFTLNNSKFDDYVDHSELEIKATANIARSTSYLYLQIDVENEAG